MPSARRSLTVSLADCLAGYLRAVSYRQRCLILASLLSCSDSTVLSVTTMWPSTIHGDYLGGYRALSCTISTIVTLKNITTPISRR